MITLDTMREDLTKLTVSVAALNGNHKGFLAEIDELRDIETERWEWLKTCLQAMADDSLNRFQATYKRMDEQFPSLHGKLDRSHRDLQQGIISLKAQLDEAKKQILLLVSLLAAKPKQKRGKR